MASTFWAPTPKDKEVSVASSPPNYTTVTINFIPYNHNEVQQFLKSVTADFGKTSDKWYYRPGKNQPEELNSWSLDFKFRDSNDALIFGLKYLR